MERYAQENIVLSEDTSVADGGGGGGDGDGVNDAEVGLGLIGDLGLGSVDGVSGAGDVISVIDKPAQHGRVSSGR